MCKKMTNMRYVSICGFIIIRRPQLNRYLPWVQKFMKVILITWWWVKTSSGGLFFLSLPPPSSRLSGKEGLENPSGDSRHNILEDHDEKNNSNINHYCEQPSLLHGGIKIWWLEVMFCKYVCTSSYLRWNIWQCSTRPFSFYCQSCENQLTPSSIVKQWHLHYNNFKSPNK